MSDVATQALIDQRSREIFARAEKVLCGGVNSPVRAMGSIGRDFPLFIESGSGVYVTDADGNKLLDYIGSWGPLIHGHADPEIVEAVKRAAERGTSFGAPTAAEVELAELVVERMPSVEMLRMTSSGTEATGAVLRLARAATGRSKILKFAGCYHGHIDGLLVKAGSGLATSGVASSHGISAQTAQETVVVDFNDEDAVRRAFAQHDFAAVIVEPIAANTGVILPQAGFLECLRELCTQSQALLIFDEVITGFRVARGGAQELLGVTPDLTIMGKVIGGGLPAAALGGSVELMELLAPCGPAYHAGTLSGNPLAVAAGIVTLNRLTQESYRRLSRVTETLVERLRQATHDFPVTISSAPGLLTLFFHTEEVKDHDDALACDTERYATFCRGMLARGIYLPPSQFEAWFISLLHNEEHIDQTVQACSETLKELY